MPFDFERPFTQYASASDIDTPAKLQAVLDLAGSLINSAGVAGRQFMPKRPTVIDTYAPGSFQGILLDAWAGAFNAQQMVVCTTLMAELVDLMNSIEQPRMALA